MSNYNPKNYLLQQLFSNIKIDAKYLCITFAINLTSFIVFINHFLLGNHGFRLPYINFNDQFHAGRWFSPVIYATYGFSNIPVYIPIFTIVINILNSYLAIQIWNKRKKTALTPYSLFTLLVITLFPANLAMFYYGWQSPLFAISQTFSILAGYFFCTNLKYRYVLAFFFTLLTLGTYQASLSLILFMTFSTLLLERLNNLKQIKMSEVKNYLKIIITIGIAGLVYIFILKFFGFSDSMQTQTSSLTSIHVKIAKIFKESIKSLYYSQPDISSELKILLLLPLGFLLVKTYPTKEFIHSRSKYFKKLAIAFVAFIILVFLTKSMFLVSGSSNFHNYRYNFTMAYFYGFIFYVVNRFLKNKSHFFFFFSLLITIVFLQNNLFRQGILLRGQQHDLAIANRILMRIEGLSDIDFNKKYNLIRIGKYSNFRKQLFESNGSKYKLKGDDHMDHGEITDIWAPAEVMRLLGSKVKFKYYGYVPQFKEKIKDAIKNTISKRKEWPSMDSVFIHGDSIFVIMENPNLQD